MAESLNIGRNYTAIAERAKIAAEKAGRDFNDIKIVAVSKTHPLDLILEAWNDGIKIFGENYAQEMKEKCEEFEKKNIGAPEWHFIGHLQTNKVKYIAPYASLVHSIDSLKLAEELNRQAERCNRKINFLLQINTSGEFSKSGCDPDSALELTKELTALPNVMLHGFMTIGTFTDDEKLQRKEFSMLREIREHVNRSTGLNLRELSMGMTGDFHIAIDEGSTIVRVGTAIFGERDYSKH